MSKDDMLNSWALTSREATTVEEFIDFVGTKGWNLCHTDRHDQADIKGLIYEFFEIDSKRLEEQRRGLLKSLSREAHGAAEAEIQEALSLAYRGEKMPSGSQEGK